MRLVVFSNHGYGFGEDVRDAAVSWAAARELPCIVVLSGRGVRPQRPAGVSPLDWARWAKGRLRFASWRRDASMGLGREARVVMDVNEPSFVESTAPTDVGLVAGFNQIFGAAAIARFGQLLNVHPSVLPLYRGPVPSRWCLANGETRSGFTVHRVTEEIDAGTILHQEEVDLVGCSSPAEADLRISKAAALSIAPILDSVVLHKGEFALRTLDARSVYRVHRTYAGFTA